MFFLREKNMDKYEKYRKEYPVFVYKNYNITEKENSVDITYEFEIPGLAVFRPGWSFPGPGYSDKAGSLVSERLVFSLGMAELISYWKAVCSPVILVECGYLDNDMKNWWKKLYFSGLGEFFFVNEIEADPDTFMSIECIGSFRYGEGSAVEKVEGCLVPIGGGKDSALTLGTLIENGVSCKGFVINGRNSVTETARAAGLGSTDLITAKRFFDRSLLGLNEKGYLNGHTPFSSVVAFSAEIAAYLHGLKYIVLSNENSANESTVAEKQVNHQYSKSYEFEKDFNFYEKKYLKTGCYYFSFLRPLSEFQIAKMFVSHRKYLKIFRSCNLGSKVDPDIWCGNCPKCLFVSLILSPFLTREEITEIFGDYLPDKPEMLDWFHELIGAAGHKPFECVGSIDEIRLAVSMTIRNFTENGEKLPLLFEDFISLGLYDPDSLDSTIKLYCESYNENNLLPPEFEKILKTEMERRL